MATEPATTSACRSALAPAWTATELRGDPHALPDKAARVRRMFTAIAPSYDLNNRVHSLGRDQSWRRRAVRLCQVRPTDEVLDAACGTGDLATAFVRAGASRVIGVDFSQAMLEIAMQKAARLDGDLAGRMSYQLADAMALPFASASFDIVSIAFGLRNVADPPTALREFRRVLRPGGRVVVLEFSPPRHPLARLIHSIYVQRLMPLTATLLARDRSGAYRYLPRSVQTFSSPEETGHMLEACGFERIHCFPMTLGICTAILGHVPGPG